MIRKLILGFCIPLAIAGCGGGDGVPGTETQASAASMMPGTSVAPPGLPEPGLPTPERPGLPAERAAPEARFTSPYALTLDRGGNLYVGGNGTVRRIAPDGSVTTLAGVNGVFGDAFGPPADGTGAAARFNRLTALDTDAAGHLYATDTFLNEGRIRKITPQGNVTTVFEGIYGLGIETDEHHGLYIADNFRSAIARLAPDGSLTRLLEGQLEPRGVVRDAGGNLYVLNTGQDFPPLGKTTYSCTLDRISPTGVRSTLAGARAAQEFDNTCGHIDGPGAGARIGAGAQGLASDQAGNLYFADTDNHTIRRYGTDGVLTTVAGSAGVAGSADGAGGEARFNRPTSVAVDAAGNLYVADSGNHAIRKITPAGVVSTYAGQPGEPGSVDAGPV